MGYQVGEAPKRIINYMILWQQCHEKSALSMDVLPPTTSARAEAGVPRIPV